MKIHKLMGRGYTFGTPISVPVTPTGRWKLRSENGEPFELYIEIKNKGTYWEHEDYLYVLTVEETIYDCNKT